MLMEEHNVAADTFGEQVIDPGTAEILQLASEQAEELRQLFLPGERESIEEELRDMLTAHLAAIGLADKAYGDSTGYLPKDVVRRIHASHRQEANDREAVLLYTDGRRLLENFARGDEVSVSAIDPELVLVEPDTPESALFRLATLLWSVPVSRGYGRRLRFLIRDRVNGKLIGIFALGSPVFNLRDRDNWIGWDQDMRRQRLINVMDAFVVGAVPPYSQLLGGKLVAALMGSTEVSEEFDRQYAERKGIIRQKVQTARLVLITTTSALGRSSLYNRLRLPGLIEFQRLGTTSGYGHFHVSEPIFRRMRRLLQVSGHKYASGHQYGDGPNWRMRVIRSSLELLDIEEDSLRHGILREIYAAPLAEHWREYLLGQDVELDLARPPAKRIAEACLRRWMIPRSERRPEYRIWTREDTWALLAGATGDANVKGRESRDHE